MTLIASRACVGFLFLVGATIGACSAPVETEDQGSSSSADTAPGGMGLDYSFFPHPEPVELKREGYTFVVRYLSHDENKTLTADEVSSLTAAGLDIVANWEGTADATLEGFSAGAADAEEADRQAQALGMPADRPIYFSVDFDARSDDEIARISDYFDGVASVITRERVGAYAGYFAIKPLFDAGKIAYGWQTHAWSEDNWDERAQLRQTVVSVEGDIHYFGDAQVDVDEAHASDFGQWRGGGDVNAAGGPCGMEGKVLVCDNATADIHEKPWMTSAVVDHLKTTHSTFDCYWPGTQHSGGNNIWYYTQGDDKGMKGFVPASAVKTSMDPVPGLVKCGE